MIRLGIQLPHLHTFHSSVLASARSKVSARAAVRSIALFQVHCQHSAAYCLTTLTTLRSSTSGLASKQRLSVSAALLGRPLPTCTTRPRTVSTCGTMRDLVNISAMGNSAALPVNASPKKPDQDVNRNVADQDGELDVMGSVDEIYQEAVRRLNTLQSNAKTLDKIRKNRDLGAYKNIPDVIDYATRVGISLDRLDDLSCIHVAGTKGKGSVCAFTESILRSSGFKTGFYSSPHLVEVRERIRINGKPLPKEDFAKHFFTIYNRLNATKEDYEGKMPPYFRFLTLMAFHTFMEEKVDVAIIEVGIGGEFDCTNIIRKPVVVGITSLGMDHMGVLGNTVEKIAWQKAGIIKLGRPAFTVPQPGDAVSVIKERAQEKEAPLHVIPSLASYGFHGDHTTIGLAGQHQQLNAALALQLAKTWVTEERPGKILFDDGDEPASKQPRVADSTPYTDEVLTGGDVPVAQPFHLPEQFERGVKSCYWAGRNQVVHREKVTYYLDGAHTPRSIGACCQWFKEKAEEEAKGLEGPVAQILIFNSTGERDEFTLLPKLVALGFHGVVFCPNIISLYSHDSSADSMNYTTTTERQMKRCHQNLIAYEKLLNQHKGDIISSLSQPSEQIQSSRTDFQQTSNSIQQLKSVTSPAMEVDQSKTAFHQSGDGAVAAGQASSDQFMPNSGLVEMEGTASDQLAQNGETGSSQLVCDETSSDQFVQSKLVKLPSIIDALQWAACCKDESLSPPSLHDPTPSDHAIAANHIQVLITGSIHLVGGVISILDPNLALEPKNS